MKKQSMLKLLSFSWVFLAGISLVMAQTTQATGTVGTNVSDRADVMQQAAQSQNLQEILEILNQSGSTIQINDGNTTNLPSKTQWIQDNMEAYQSILGNLKVMSEEELEQGGVTIVKPELTDDVDLPGED